MTTTYGKGTSSVGNFCGTTRWVRANIVCQIIFCTNVKACSVICWIFQSSWVFVFNVKLSRANLTFCIDLLKWFVIDKHLLWVSSHAFFGWVRIHGTNTAKITEFTRRLPHIALFSPLTCRDNIATLHPNFSMRSSLESDVLLGHKKVWLSVHTAFCHNCSAVRDSLQSTSKCRERSCFCSVTRIVITVWRNPSDISCRHRIVSIHCFIFFMNTSRFCHKRICQNQRKYHHHCSCWYCYLGDTLIPS